MGCSIIRYFLANPSVDGEEQNKKLPPVGIEPTTTGSKGMQVMKGMQAGKEGKIRCSRLRAGGGGGVLCDS